MNIQDIKLQDIEIDESMNCRGYIDLSTIAPLSKDIKQKGLMQPVVITDRQKIKDLPHSNKSWYLVAGFRRFKAIKMLDWEFLPASIVEITSLQEIKVLNFRENIHRENLNIIQEANVVKYLVDLGNPINFVATMLNRPTGWVRTRLQLLDLPDYMQNMARDNVLNQAHIQKLYRLKESPDAQEALYRRFANNKTEKGIVEIVREKAEDTKKARTKQEVFHMLEYLVSTTGANFGTRCLAWVMGNISDLDIFNDIKEACPEYTVPADSLETLLALERQLSDRAGVK